MGARRQALEAARRLHVESMLERRKERDARVEELRELRRQERDDAAREKVRGGTGRDGTGWDGMGRDGTRRDGTGHDMTFSAVESVLELRLLHTVFFAGKSCFPT